MMSTLRPLRGRRLVSVSAALVVRTRRLSLPSPALLEGLPKCSLITPGNCQFGDEFQPVPLLERISISPSSSVLRFGLPDSSMPLNLSTCACILARAPSMSNDQEHFVIRPYTPISTNAQTGSFDLLIKDYGSNGNLSRYMNSVIKVGETIEFKHIPLNVKIQAPFEQKHILMLAGGTGITPMIQALHAILGTKDSDSKEGDSNQHVTLLYGSQSSNDILGKELLDKWSKHYSDRFQVVQVLSDEDPRSEWNGRLGFIDTNLLMEFLAPNNVIGNTLVLVCGPPPMYKALCGPREEPEHITGTLAELGFTPHNVYKF